MTTTSAMDSFVRVSARDLPPYFSAGPASLLVSAK